MTSFTPVFTLPYPDPGDPVADGDDAMEALAERLEDVLPRRYKINVNFAASNVAVVTLNFGVTFASLPTVVATPNAEGSSLNNYFATVDSMTTSSCRIVVRHYLNTSGTATVPVGVLVMGVL